MYIFLGSLLIALGLGITFWGTRSDGSRMPSDKTKDEDQNIYTTCSIAIQMKGSEAASILSWNKTVNPDEMTVDLATKLLDLEAHWFACCNTGEAKLSIEDATDLFRELDSEIHTKYRGSYSTPSPDEEVTIPDSLSAPENIIVVLLVIYKFPSAFIETSINSTETLFNALSDLVQKGSAEEITAMNVSFLPARLGDNLTDDQVLIQFPDLIRI